MKKGNYFLNGIVLIIVLIFFLPADSSAQRTEGEIVLYTFEEFEDGIRDGNTIKDQSGVEPIIDLVRYPRSEGAITLLEDRNGAKFENFPADRNHGLFADPKADEAGQGDYVNTAPAGLTSAIQASNAITVEYWIAPGDTMKNEEARVFSYSTSSGDRNFTVMVDFSRIEIRFRTVANGDNGRDLGDFTPGVFLTQEDREAATPSGTYHIVYTYDWGEEKAYYNGELAATRSDRGNDISNWDDTYALIIGTERNNTGADRRQFEGEIYLAAIYDKALTAEEVQANYAAGNEPATSVDDEVTAPGAFLLEQNYPNPFNPDTKIRYRVNKSAQVQLSVFNMSGQELARLVDGNKSAGNYEVKWTPAEDISTGIYFYRLRAGDYVETRKMVFAK